MIIIRRIVSISKDVEKAKKTLLAASKKNELYKMHDCGCCDNVTIVGPTLMSNGKYKLEAIISEKQNKHTQT